jgi:ribosome-associated protein
LESLEIAQNAANTAVDRKADDVLILDVAPLTTVADCFVIASAPSRVQTKDIAQKIEDSLELEGVRKLRVQGRDEGSWILLDYGSVVVHVFLRQEREFYDLEGRWSAAKVLFDSNTVAPTHRPSP